MGVKWTKDQQKVIDLRKRNILVSAAAGSGKTAVLVERIVGMVTDKEHPVDIDRLLIVTFTNAAAAEMRERISAAIEKALDANPMDVHLQRQLTLIHNAQITTIDSFCLYVVRNHFYEIDMEPNFRIGDEGEFKLLRQDVLKKVLEAHYVEPDEAFSDFIEGYAPGRNDDAVAEMILNLYHFSRSYPWPKKWLSEAKQCYEISSVEELNQSDWIGDVVKNIRLVLADIVIYLEGALKLSLESDGPNMYAKALRSDIEIYERMAEIAEFSKLQEALKDIRYERLSSSKGYTGSEEKLEQVKQMREQAKEAVKKLVKQYCFASAEQMVEQLKAVKPAVETLISLTEEFTDAYAAEKKKKNLVDFYDIEHFALEILVDEESGQAKKTAEAFRDAYIEIMIDGYQDSNYVQEAILTSISKMERGENNIFMVGDVKQSIYRFRLARPELFMEKYDTYSLDDGKEQRIDLHQNFRSRKEVIDTVNDVFYRIMQRDLGNVEYDELAALHAGAVYPESKQMQTELLLTEYEEELLLDTDYTNKKLLEAKLVSNRIRQLMTEQYVTDKNTGELRPVRYSDIVILLRGLSGFADVFVEQLNADGIPAHAVSSTGYFGTVEVQTVLSMLRLLDNPRQDIPMAAVLKSPMGGFSDEELAEIRLYEKEIPFHKCVLDLCEDLLEKGFDDIETGYESRLLRFYEKYLFLREKVSDTPIHELIELVLKETGYGDYLAAMPAGNRRKANIEMLLEKAIAYEKTSYKGLFHFVRYIDELQKYDVDFGEADLVGENEDVVRIMSIHKSKGLEFPIVFVSGLGKSFNKQDARSRMVLHPEYGIGLDVMDGKRRVRIPTIAKKVIAKQIELENLGEELRVLYVALTRAKEKLILTGNCKDLEEKIKKYQQAGEESSSEILVKLSYRDRADAGCYLDWLMPVMITEKAKYSVSQIGVSSLVEEEVEKQTASFLAKEERIAQVKMAEEELVIQLDELFQKNYPYTSDIARKNKYSVSELKHRAMRKAFEEEENDATPAFLEEEHFESYVPKFMQRKKDVQTGAESEEHKCGDSEQALEEATTFGVKETTVNQGALRGTAMHRVLECFDFTSDVSVDQQLLGMLENGRITKELYELVHIPSVKKFLNSATGRRMKEAAFRGELYREKPFVMGFTANELSECGFDEGERSKKAVIDGEGMEEDLTLIQGIIDVFWIEEDHIILLDYKTDSVKTPEELVLRYETQMELYAKALNRVFAESGKKVKEKLIYSFRFGKKLKL